MFSPQILDKKKEEKEFTRELLFSFLFPFWVYLRRAFEKCINCLGVASRVCREEEEDCWARIENPLLSLYRCAYYFILNSSDDTFIDGSVCVGFSLYSQRDLPNRRRKKKLNLFVHLLADVNY
jgi:hypothetical protein